ncbi:MAG: alpha amylase N-terminal ig-like domain-containing protein, partial [Rudaea sp.]
MNAQSSSFRSLALAFFLLAGIALALGTSVPLVMAAPSSVTLASNFQSPLGCPGDWDPGCAATHLTDMGNGVWRGEFSLPALSDGQYKMALNGTWTESYAGNHTAGGNTTIVTATPATVRFYYDDETHAVLDSVMDKIATVAGDMQSELGCPGDWQPDCVRTLMVDPDGNGIYSFETTSLLAGSYQFKVARDEGWNTSYPANNVGFTVATAGQKVAFYWNSADNSVWVQAAHAHDNNVEWNGLSHDSRSLVYRTPGGAVPAGATVLVRFRTFHDDVTRVDLRLYDLNSAAQKIVRMQLVASDVDCYEAALAADSCDFWQAELKSDSPDNFWYRFIVQDGSKTAYYADDTAALDGGLGAPTDNLQDNSWALMLYDPKFKAPAWLSDAIIYQIFPDRFRNGTGSNDPKTGDTR